MNLRGQAVIEALVCSAFIIGFVALGFNFINRQVTEFVHIENDFKLKIKEPASK